MENVNLSGLIPAVAGKIAPMIEDMLAAHASNLHSIHIVGSAVIPDYNEKLSDINSIVVLHDMDLGFLEFLAPLGGKYGRKRIAAPLIMTPHYIRDSLDAFPIEFHDFKLIHRTVYGEDIFAKLEIDRNHLRVQCEREIKSKLIGLRQAYLSSLGKKKHLAVILIKSFTGSMALFRAIISLLGKEPPVARAEVISLLGSSSGIDAGVFRNIFALKARQIKPSQNELAALFKGYYAALESTGKLINELPS